MNRPGTGPQSLRGLSGFPSQQPGQARNPSLASARMQNKLGGASGWGYGLPMSVATGLDGQSRPQNSGSFAQSIGTSQPAAPLDLSEFPTLSGTPQTHHQNPGQTLWANATQRASHQAASQQRSQQLHASAPQAASIQTPSQSSQQSQSQHAQQDMFPSTAPFAGGLDEYRHTNQSNLSQQPGATQPQTGSIDEFPPLGRNAIGDMSHERRSSLMQAAGLNGFGSISGFAGGLGQLSNLRNRDLISDQDHVSRLISPSPLGQGTMSVSSRSPLGGRLAQPGISEEDKSNGTPGDVNSNKTQSLPMRVDTTSSQRNMVTMQSPPQLQQQTQQFNLFGADSPLGNPNPDHRSLSQMTDFERYSLPGLFGMMRNESRDVQFLTTGQDLTTLGLDLNSPEPLCDNFASPFAQVNDRFLEPDFNLPECYRVANVCPIDTKVCSFSDDTLFYIFYTMPKDIMQEAVAQELTGRGWRWHKKEQIWFTADPQFPDPVPLGNNTERGYYICWDSKNWKREKIQMIVQESDVDARYLYLLRSRCALANMAS